MEAELGLRLVPFIRDLESGAPIALDDIKLDEQQPSTSFQRSVIRCDGLQFANLLHTLRNSRGFRDFFTAKAGVERGERPPGLLVFIRLRNPSSWPTDFAWNERVEALLRRNLESDRLMWWLSTLGGAYSALGEYTRYAVDKAAETAVKQLRLATMIGDPVLESRCRVYLALAFIQYRQYSRAARILRREFELGRRYGSQLLQNACKGVWAKLQLERARHRALTIS